MTPSPVASRSALRCVSGESTTMPTWSHSEDVPKRCIADSGFSVRNTMMSPTSHQSSSLDTCTTECRSWLRAVLSMPMLHTHGTSMRTPRTHATRARTSTNARTRKQPSKSVQRHDGEREIKVIL